MKSLSIVHKNGLIIKLIIFIHKKKQQQQLLKHPIRILLRVKYVLVIMFRKNFTPHQLLLESRIDTNGKRGRIDHTYIFYVA